MILKVVRQIKKGEPGWFEGLGSRTEIFSGVCHLENFYDGNEDLFYDIGFEKGNHALLKITEKQNENESVAIVNQLWLMDDKGNTIEKLI